MIETSLIRATAWLAFALYVAAELVRNPRIRGNATLARWLNSIGCATLLVHILIAFHLRHHWSHAAAYTDTARQTAALTGWNWGGGVYINYLFALLWIREILRSWTKPAPIEPHPRLQTWTLRGIFLFMFLNGAVIFVQGPIRWLGLTGCLLLIAAWASQHFGQFWTAETKRSAVTAFPERTRDLPRSKKL